ncbi:MAG: leucine-rich repeat protein [Bacteroidales bacterium]|nr:leucine-rich repeat protein [Bacteroidales bacterium]
MKKIIFTFILFLLATAFAAEANPVAMRTVREVAMKFMNANGKDVLRSMDDLELVATYNISRGDAAFYIFNIPNGFVIVSADDCVTPILGYSNEGQFDVDNIPIQLQDYLQGFVEQIQFGIENHIETDAKKAQQWEMVRTTGRLTNNRSDEVVGPLVSALWNQTCYYNSKCPEDPYGSCGHVLVGCVATSMSQIMHYWGYPEHGSGSYSYTPSGYPEQSVDFGSTIYDWANMPNSLNSSSTSEQIDAVATLMWHCGVSVAMHYGPNFSGSWLSTSSLINYFNYSDEMSYEFRNDYSDAIWKAKLKDCLNLQRPLWYDGSSSYGSGGAHAFVCDGYDNNDMFHFNWGWGGSSDGFFTLDDNLYDRYNGAVFNIHPQSDDPTVYEINVSVKNNEGGTVSGGGTFVHGETVTLSATADEGLCFQYWEENGGIASRDANYSFPANFSRNLEAVFNVPVPVSLLAMEGGTVSGEGIYCYGECEVIAVPDEGYDFAYWTENGEIVSIEADYVFLLIDERHLTAHFVEEGIIDFEDNNVKAVCLSHWDNNSDGELSLAEAVRVTNLGQTFINNSNIISFDELLYFTNLTTISNSAFYNCTKLTSVVLPNTVTSIGSSAFRNCRQLTSVSFPDALISIGVSAFNGCNSLTSIVFPNSLTTIEGSAFYACSSLASVTFPDSITTIGSGAFRNCTSLTSVDLPNSLTSISERTFSGCTGLKGSLVLPESVTTIGPSAFEDCTGLTSLVLPNTITSIGSCAFENCSGLSGQLAIPNSVTSIGRYAFYYCSGLTVLTLPNSVTSIGDAAFSGCSGITGSVTIPNTIISLNTSTFSGCSSLTSMVLPDSLSSIGDYVFNNCRSLSSIVILNDEPPTVGFNALNNVSSNITVYVPCESVEAYQSANGWNAFSNIVGLCGTGTVTVVLDPLEGGAVTGAGTYDCGASCTVSAVPNEGYFFANWIENGNVVSSDANYSFVVTGEKLLTAHFVLDENIVFADANVKAICVANWDTNGDGELSYSEACEVRSLGEVFKGNTEITSFEELQYFINLSSINDNAFYGCSGLTGSLYIPNSVTLIGASAFRGCSGLTGSLVLPDFTTMIGNYAFSNCSGFTGSLIIPNSVISIGESAFSGCNGFTGSLTLSDAVTSIGKYTFSNCRGFTGSLTIPSSVTTIGESAFSNCISFTGDLIIPNSVTSIGNYAFYCCSGFDGNLTIGNSVSSIGKSAFYNCWHLSGILTIPNSVTTIGDDAFCYCAGFIGSLTIPNSVRTIGEFAFYYLNGLRGSLTIGSSVLTIGRYAFSSSGGLNSIIVLRQQPPTILANTFDEGIPIYVPCESVEAYQSATGWDAFPNIMGMCSDGTISVVADPIEGGVVAGGGTYEGGILCSITATPNEGFTFANWSENGSLVSCDSTYSFIVTGESVLTAHFVPDENIVFADANVKALCVANWDSNGDGELSYHEAAIVTSIEYVFSDNTEITSFDELQYFIGLPSINSNAFYNCYNLTSVTIPSAVTAIESGAFYNCSGLTGSLIIPNSVTTIGASAFYGCSGLSGGLTIPDAVTSIGEWAFAYCYGFVGPLLVGNAVNSIGNYAFYYCNGLTSLTLGNSVTSIGNYALTYCYALNSMIALSEMPPTVGTSAFYQIASNIPLYVPCESVEAYQLAAGWDAFSNIIGMCSSGTVSVASDPVEAGTVSGAGTYEGGSFCTVTAQPNEGYEFAYWTENGSMVSTDANYRFVVMGDRLLTARFVGEGNIVFADANVKALCVQNWDTNDDGELSYLEAARVSSFEDVFSYNEDITSFDELQYFVGLSSIEDYAFDYCYNLTSMTLPNTVSSIGEGAFSGCYNLTGSLTLPNSLISIGSSAFSACYSLTGSLTIPNSVTSIGEWAFGDCYGFTGLLTLGNSVTSIGAYAFYDCYGFKGSLTIPNSVTTIGEWAFGDCYGFTGLLTIGNSVTSIGNYAFYYCSGLTSLTLGNSVTSISNYAFYDCYGLNSMFVLSEMPPMLASNGFYGVATDIPVYVPCESVEAYQSAAGWDAFSNIIGMCSSGTVSVVADPVEGGTVSGAGTYEGGSFCTVTATPNEGYCFANWTKNGSVVSNDSNYSLVVTEETVMTAHFVLDGNIVFADANVKAICVENWDINGDGELSYLEAAMVTTFEELFSGNTEITSFEELQYFIGLSSISDYGFSGCSSLTGALLLPSSLTSIGNSAFYNCYGLTGDLTIPDAVVWIGYDAFEGCSGFSGALTIGNCVTTISDYAFYDCSGLTGSLTLPNAVVSIGYGAFDYCSGLDAVYYTGDLGQWCNISFESYSSNPLYYAHNLYINDELVTDLLIPETVMELKPYVFANATCLTSLTIPNSVTAIGNYAFYYCTGLTDSLSIPNSVTAIGNYAFNYCTGLTGSLTIPNSVISIGNWAFASCSGLTGSLTIPNTVTTIGSYAFYYCNGFTGDLIIPNSVTSIGNSAFYGCSGFTGDLIISSLVTSIASSTFSGCIGFTGDLTIPGSVTAISSYAFSNCRGFSGSLTIPNSVTSIGIQAFSGCNGLTALSIGRSVTLIEGYAFYNCTNLDSVTVHAKTPPTLQPSSFYNCPKSIPFYVPCGSLDVYQSAAYWNEFTNIQEVCLQQTITLSQGWNWFSTHVEITLEDLQAALVAALPDTTISINSQSDGSTTYNGTSWRGTLTSLDLSQMYMISVATNGEMTLEGMPIDPIGNLIIIHPDFNWMAFPLSQSMTLTDAFTGFVVNGDMVISQDGGSSTYTNRWRGTLDVLEPGKGYMYKSAVTSGGRTFTFPASSK